VKFWELIADKLSKAGWSWGCVSAIDSNGRTIWIADAHRGDGKRFVVSADERLPAFVEFESAILLRSGLSLQAGQIFLNSIPLTDSSQAEDISPARFFATSGPANHRINAAGEKKGSQSWHYMRVGYTEMRSP